MNKNQTSKKATLIIFTIIAVLLTFSVLAKEDSINKEIQYNSNTLFEINENQKNINLKEVREDFDKNDKVDVLVWLKEGAPEEAIDNLKNFETKYIYESSNGFAGKTDYKTFKQLTKDKRVNYIVLDKPVEAHLQQSRPLIRANLLESTLNITGTNIVTCLVDSGMNYSNIYLSNSYLGGYDFVNNDPFPLDDNGHGTRVAGVIASTHAAARGASPGSKIVAVKVLNSGATGYLSTIAAGVDWCITNKNMYNISIISMSLGTIGGIYNPTTNPMSYEPSLASAYNNNITIVASSGNDGSTSGISYPAISPHVLSVGATYDANGSSLTAFGCTDTANYADKVTCFSNRAPFLTLMAPGAVITSTQMQGGFGGSYGTSFAAPHVTGTIALMLQRNPLLTPQEIKAILVLTGKIITDNLTNQTYSRVDAFNATTRDSLSGFGCTTSNARLCQNDLECSPDSTCHRMNGQWGICSGDIVC